MGLSNIFRSFFVLLLILVISFSCTYDSSYEKPAPYVVCTTSMIGDLVQNLLVDIPGLKVKVLMGEGIDPHSYEPKPSDVFALGEAGVIVFNGLHLEGKMANLFRRIKKEKRVIAMADGMPEKDLFKTSAEGFDPHVWFDPILWLKGIENCKNQLILAFPQYKSQIEINYLVLENQIRIKYQSLQLKMNEIPVEKRVLITSHDAFHYFGRAFDVQVMGIQGVSTVTEPGLSDVSNLVQFILDHKVPAVFIESSVPKKAIESVVEACRSKGHNLKIGGELYSDALGSKKSLGGTYRGMLQHNVSVFVRAMK
jgi:manganese/zinc/iron transport system substrate-binding protein